MSKKWKDFLYDALMFVSVAGFFALLVYFLCGCSPRYITVPEYHYESHHTADTVLLRDSFLKENNTIVREADSAMLIGLGIRLKEGERAILILKSQIERLVNQQKEVMHDTIVRVDSIRVPYPVEKKLSRWQNLCISFGGCAFGITIALLLLLMVLMYYRWKKL